MIQLIDGRRPRGGPNNTKARGTSRAREAKVEGEVHLVLFPRQVSCQSPARQAGRT